MSRAEYLAASVALRVLGWLFSLLPIVPDRIVLASPRTARLDGNLRYVAAALRARRPDLRPVVLFETYGYGLRAKVAYFARAVRGMYYLRTSRLFIVDNAYLPVHVAPHRRGTTVVQVWHAASAVKRFGLDTVRPPAEPERTFLHRYYDYVIVSAEGVREVYSAALRTPIDRVLALGTPRTDFFFDEEAMAAARDRLLQRLPGAGRAAGRAPRADPPGARQGEDLRGRPRSSPSSSASSRPSTRSCSRCIPTSTRRRSPRRATTC